MTSRLLIFPAAALALASCMSCGNPSSEPEGTRLAEEPTPVPGQPERERNFSFPGAEVSGPMVEGGEGDQCPAEEYQDFVGQNLDDISYPEDLRVRVLRPGMMVTQEFSPSRTNIKVDENGVVERVYCG